MNHPHDASTGGSTMNRLDVATEKPDLDRAPVRRVREEVRDGIAVAATSVAASVLLVLVATVLMRLAG
jgi:hypothetical protein